MELELTSDVLPILNVIRKFRAAVPYGNDVPVVIHCNATMWENW